MQNVFKEQFWMHSNKLYCRDRTGDSKLPGVPQVQGLETCSSGDAEAQGQGHG